jgi:uncharacterized delta-60 repeat protein
MNLDRSDRTYLRAAFVLGIMMAAWAGARAQEKGGDAKPKAATPAQLSIALDPTFGKGGMVAELLDAKANQGALGRFLTVDRQNRPVIAGNSWGQRFAVGRFTTEGQPDTTFANTGKTSVCIETPQVAKTPGNPDIQFTHGCAIDAKGRLVVVGKGAGIDGGRRWDFVLLRFTTDGQLDKAFCEVGYRKLQTHVSWNIGLAVAMAPDCSSLVAAGYAYVEGAGIIDPLLIRLTEAGEIDEAFSAAANGSLRWLVKEGTSATPTGVAIDSQGRYLVGMNMVQDSRPIWALARLKTDGEIDETFGERGLWSDMLDSEAADEQTFSTAIDPAGRIVMGGYSQDGSGLRRLAVARITDRGQSDPSFGPEGKGYVILAGYGANVTYRYGPRAAVSKNRIAIEGAINGAKGNTKCFGVAVMDETGNSVAKIEPRLFPGSQGTDQPWGIAFDGEDRIVVGGASQIPGKSRFAVARYVVK